MVIVTEDYQSFQSPYFQRHYVALLGLVAYASPPLV